MKIGLKWLTGSTAAAVFFLMISCGADTTANKKEVLFEIKKGESFKSVSKNLKEQHIIKSTTRFRVKAKLMMKDNNVRYGVYQVSPREKYAFLIEKFYSGETYSLRITVPEGSSIFQIADILASKNLGSREDFLKACGSREFLTQFGLAPGDSLEGYLYPDTYLIPLNYETGKIIQMMIDNFNKNVDADMRMQIEKKGLNLKKVLTMASIIEKESKHEFEKPIISGVYYNRLKQRIRLQADPTLIYALMLAGKYDGNIRSRDFNFNSKYNTYSVFGLPPGPIANSGRTSILAAIYPADVDYIYFVAKPDGTHYFSRTLKEHNRAVYQYQKLPAIERRKKKQQGP